MFAQQRCVQSIHVQKNKPETLFKFTVENMASPKNLSGFSLVTSLRFVEGCLTITCPQEKKKKTSHPPHLTSPPPFQPARWCSAEIQVIISRRAIVTKGWPWTLGPVDSEKSTAKRQVDFFGGPRKQLCISLVAIDLSLKMEI